MKEAPEEHEAAVANSEDKYESLAEESESFEGN